MNIEILNIQPILVDTIKGRNANAFSWQFTAPYRLGNDDADLPLGLEFYNVTQNEDGQNQVELIAVSDIMIPSSVLTQWQSDSVITNYIITQVPNIVLVP
jgi:hypothetical protein